MTRKILVFALLALMAGFSATADDMTAEQIVAKNLEARGGAAAIEAVDSVRIHAKGAGMGGAEVPIVIEWKRPNMVRQEINVQGQSIVQAYDGTKAWMIMPFTGSTDPQEMPEDAAKQIREQADVVEGVLYNYAEKGHTVEFMGEEEFEGTPAYKLKVTRKGGDIDYYYLDTDAFLEFKGIFKREINGQEVDVEVTFGDYKKVGGMMMPHSLESKVTGMPGSQAMTIEKVEINPELSNDIFMMPEPATVEEGADS